MNILNSIHLPKALARNWFSRSTVCFNFLLQVKYSPSTTRLRGEETDPAAVAKHNATLEKKLNAYDKILSKRKYLAGDVIVFIFTFIVILFC